MPVLNSDKCVNGKLDHIDFDFAMKEVKVIEEKDAKNNNVTTNEQIPRRDLKELLKRRIPIISWLPNYTIAKGCQDLLAGFTVGLTEIPQGIAYAVVAGLEPQYGLYSGFMGCFMYGIFGSCKDINIGPTAIMALMAQKHVEKLGPDMAVLLTFLSGCIILVLGFLRLGFLVEFISFPVTAGFTSAAALQIASSQIKPLLGQSGKAEGFLEAWVSVFRHFNETKFWDTILGVTAILILAVMREFKRFGSLKFNPNWSFWRNFVGRISWVLSVGRNALVVVVATILCYILYINGNQPFKLVGKVKAGLPKFEPPPFSTTFNNKTYDFTDMAKNFGSIIIFTPLVAILESIAIAKAFSKGRSLDVTQELIALGISNLMGSFVRSMPVTGSFTRTAVNNASGVQTQLAGIITGTLVLVAIAALTSTFYFIPKTILSAVVIGSMFYLIEFKAVFLLWKTKKADLVPFLVTLSACLFLSLEYGIIIGVGVNILFLLHPVARPDVKIEKIHSGLYMVTPMKNLHFPAAEYFREKIMKDCNDPFSTVIINGKYVCNIDATVARNLKVLVEDITQRKQKIIFWQFKLSVMNICLGTDEKMLKFFKDDSLESLSEECKLSEVTTA